MAVTRVTPRRTGRPKRDDSTVYLSHSRQSHPRFCLPRVFTARAKLSRELKFDVRQCANALIPAPEHIKQMSIENLELIEQALDLTLNALQQERASSPRRAVFPPGVNYWTEDELIETSDQVMFLIDVLNGPVQFPLSRQLNSIGALLFAEVKSTERMKETAEWVAALDVENYEFRMDALDRAFEGLGEGDDIWLGA